MKDTAMLVTAILFAALLLGGTALLAKYTGQSDTAFLSVLYCTTFGTLIYRIERRK